VKRPTYQLRFREGKKKSTSPGGERKEKELHVPVIASWEKGGHFTAHREKKEFTVSGGAPTGKNYG